MEIFAIHLGNCTHKSGQYKQCFFSKQSWKKKWIFAEKVCVSTKCHPNGECNMQLIPVNNRRTLTQNQPRRIIHKNEWMRGRKSIPCVRMEKNQYVHLGTQAAEMPVFHVQRFGTKSEQGPIQNIISGRTFCVGAVWWFFLSCDKTNPM